MIYINLLPIRDMQRKARNRKGVGLFFLSLVAVAAVLVVVAFNLNSRIGDLDTDIAQLEAEKQKYINILQEIKKLKQDKKRLTVKIEAIKTLKSKSQVPVHMLDTIARAVSSPADSLWLRSLRQDGSTLALSGVAMDNTRLADFMDDLTASPYFTRADLGQSSMERVAGRNLKSFKLTLSINNPKGGQGGGKKK